MDSSDNEQEREIALFALHLCSLTQSEELKELFENKVSIKMGIHKGIYLFFYFPKYAN